jgi:cell shape-determining protein MreC
MKRTYRQKSNHSLAIVTGLILLIALVMWWNPIGIRSVAQQATAPAAQVSASIDAFFKTVATVFADKAALQEQVDELESQYARLELEVLTDDALEEFREAFETTITQPAESDIQAAVYMRPPQTPFDVLIVGAGEQSGVLVGDSVFVGPVYIGTVVEVYEKTATVRLASAAETLTQVRVAGEIDVQVSGEGNGQFIGQITINESVKQGDVVEYISEAMRVPLGRVVEVVERQSDPFREVYIKSPISLSQLDVVTIRSNQR